MDRLPLEIKLEIWKQLCEDFLCNVETLYAAMLVNREWFKHLAPAYYKHHEKDLWWIFLQNAKYNTDVYAQLVTKLVTQDRRDAERTVRDIVQVPKQRHKFCNLTEIQIRYCMLEVLRDRCDFADSPIRKIRVDCCGGEYEDDEELGVMVPWGGCGGCTYITQQKVVDSITQLFVPCKGVKELDVEAEITNSGMPLDSPLLGLLSGLVDFDCDGLERFALRINAIHAVSSNYNKTFTELVKENAAVKLLCGKVRELRLAYKPKPKHLSTDPLITLFCGLQKLSIMTLMQYGEFAYWVQALNRQRHQLSELEFGLTMYGSDVEDNLQYPRDVQNLTNLSYICVRRMGKRGVMARIDTKTGRHVTFPDDPSDSTDSEDEWMYDEEDLESLLDDLGGGIGVGQGYGFGFGNAHGAEYNYYPDSDYDY